MSSPNTARVSSLSVRWPRHVLRAAATAACVLVSPMTAASTPPTGEGETEGETPWYETAPLIDVFHESLAGDPFVITKAENYLHWQLKARGWREGEDLDQMRREVVDHFMAASSRERQWMMGVPFYTIGLMPDVPVIDPLIDLAFDPEVNASPDPTIARDAEIARTLVSSCAPVSDRLAPEFYALFRRQLVTGKHLTGLISFGTSLRLWNEESAGLLREAASLGDDFTAPHALEALFSLDLADQKGIDGFVTTFRTALDLPDTEDAINEAMEISMAAAPLRRERVQVVPLLRETLEMRYPADNRPWQGYLPVLLTVGLWGPDAQETLPELLALRRELDGQEGMVCDAAIRAVRGHQPFLEGLFDRVLVVGSQTEGILDGQSAVELCLVWACDVATREQRESLANAIVDRWRVETDLESPDAKACSNTYSFAKISTRELIEAKPARSEKSRSFDLAWLDRETERQRRIDERIRRFGRQWDEQPELQPIPK